MSHRVFVNLETGTADPVDGFAYVIDADVLDDQSRTVLEGADDFSHYGPEAVSIVEAWAMPLEAAVDIVEGLRRVVFPTVSRRSAGWVGTGTLRSAVSIIEADVEGSLEAVRDAAVVELRRSLLILDKIASSTLDAGAVLDWLEVEPSGLRMALEAELEDEVRRVADGFEVVVLGERDALEERVRAEILDGSTVEEWAKGQEFRRAGGLLWLDEYNDVVDIGEELDAEVRRVADGIEALEASGGES